MSRESLLDEAIVKAKEAEDWQLVEWLRMARGGESAARWYSDKLREAHRTERKLLDENDELRELVRYMHRCYVRGHDWGPYGAPEKEWVEEQMRELGIEAG